MKFRVISYLMSFLSSVSLFSHPAVSMKDDLELSDPRSKPSVGLKSEEKVRRSNLKEFLSKQDYPGAFNAMKAITTASNEEIVDFLMKSNAYEGWPELDPETKGWVVSKITGKSKRMGLERFLSKQDYPTAFMSLRATLPPTVPDAEIVSFLMTSNHYPGWIELDPDDKGWVVTKITKAAKRKDLLNFLSKQDYPGAFNGMKATTTASDEVIVDFLMKSNKYPGWTELDPGTKGWVVATITGKPYESEISSFSAPPNAPPFEIMEKEKTTKVAPIFIGNIDDLLVIINELKVELEKLTSERYPMKQGKLQPPPSDSKRKNLDKLITSNRASILEAMKQLQVLIGKKLEENKEAFISKIKVMEANLEPLKNNLRIKLDEINATELQMITWNKMTEMVEIKRNLKRLENETVPAKVEERHAYEKKLEELTKAPGSKVIEEQADKLIKEEMAQTKLDLTTKVGLSQFYKKVVTTINGNLSDSQKRCMSLKKEHDLMIREKNEKQIQIEKEVRAHKRTERELFSTRQKLVAKPVKKIKTSGSVTGDVFHDIRTKAERVRTQTGKAIEKLESGRSKVNSELFKGLLKKEFKEFPSLEEEDSGEDEFSD